MMQIFICNIIFQLIWNIYVYAICNMQIFAQKIISVYTKFPQNDIDEIPTQNIQRIRRKAEI